jgi:hypothetical protein
LKDVHGNAGLQIRRGREDFRALDRDWRVAGNERCRNIAQRLDAERQGRHIDEDDVAEFAGQHTRLNGGSLRDAFHWVDT